MFSLMPKDWVRLCLVGVICSQSTVSSASGQKLEYQALLESIQTQIINIGLSEKTFLHSVGRITGSVIESEESFFVSTADLDNLDIVVKDGSKAIVQFSGGTPFYRERDQSPDQCVDRIRSTSYKRPLLEVRPTQDTTIFASAQDANQEHLFQQYVLEQLISSDRIRVSQERVKGSQYQRLLAGGSWEEPSSVILMKRSSTAQVQAGDTERLKSVRGNSLRDRNFVSLELAFFSKDRELKSALISASRAEIAFLDMAEGSTSGFEAKPWVTKIRAEIEDFTHDLPCLIEYPSSAQVRNGKLHLNAGLNAGYLQGDKLILIPNREYFVGRGLLAASERIAIASINSIDANIASLNIISGNPELEDGAEFNVKPILEVL